MKKTIISIITIIIAVIVILLISIFGRNKTVTTDVTVPSIGTDTVQTIPLCFYYEKQTSRGLYDISWLKLNITGNIVTGEFRNLPAEKDSKIGVFTGEIDSVDKMSMTRTADVWWESMAEGMQNYEQLKVVFGEGTAQAAFGEMVDQGDGVYVYKNADQLTLGQSMTDVACGDLDDRIIVEKYIRANIKNLVPEKTVVGGTWYATIVHIDPSKKTGIMSYEDGHVASKASFNYIRDNDSVEINSIEKIK